MATRFFKPAYSEQVVSTYAPLPLDTIQYGAEQAQAARVRADEALDTYTAQQQDLIGQLTPANKEKAAQILRQDDEFIERMIDPEGGVRYQDMVPLIRRQARKTRQQIQPYAEDSQRVQQFREQVNELYDKGELSLSLRNYYNRQLADYGGLEFDETGAPSGFRPPSIVRSVDINKQIEDFMDELNTGDTSTIVREYGADPAFLEEIRTEGLTPENRENVQALIENRVLGSPENQQYLMAEWQAENDLRQRAGEEPVEFEQFVRQWTDPYVGAASMTTTEQTIRSNPYFDADAFRSAASTGSIPVKIGTVPLDFTTPSGMNEHVANLEENMETQAQALIGSLPAGLRERAYIDEEGNIAVDDPVVGGTNLEDRIKLVNAQLEQTRNQYQRYKEFDKQLRKDAGLDQVDENDRQMLDSQYEDYLNSLGYFKQGPNAATPQEWQRLKASHWNLFQESDDFDDALKEVSPAYQKYLSLFNERTKQGTMTVGAPAQIPAKQRNQYINDLYRLGNHRVLYNAMDRSEYGREEAGELINNSKRIEPVGPITDVSEGKTYVMYNIYKEDGAEPEVVLMEPGINSLSAFQSAGMNNTQDSVIYGKLLTLGDGPGQPKSTTIPLGEDTGQRVTIQLLPRDQQTPNAKYSIILPYADGNREQLARDEDEARSYIKDYIARYSQVNSDEQPDS